MLLQKNWLNVNHPNMLVSKRSSSDIVFLQEYTLLKIHEIRKKRKEREKEREKIKKMELGFSKLLFAAMMTSGHCFVRQHALMLG